MTRVRRHAEFFSNTKLIESQLSEAPVASNDRKTSVHRCFLREEMPHALTCFNGFVVSFCPLDFIFGTGVLHPWLQHSL